MSPLRRWRLERGLTQEQLAEAITKETSTPISQGMVSRWEVGACKPGMDSFIAIKNFSHGEITEESFNGTAA
jgi:transcriptional regulator with XRE-family HTH domain